MNQFSVQWTKNSLTTKILERQSRNQKEHEVNRFKMIILRSFVCFVITVFLLRSRR
jgi:hypothetical protein